MSNETKNAVTDEAGAATIAENNAAPVTTPEETKAATAGGVGVYTHKFRKPYEYGGATYKEMTFNFERLTGRDMVSIETEMQSRNEYALAPEISRNFQGLMAAKAAGIGSDVLEAMPLNDFNKITNAARDFLIDTGY
jgi:hypothetical protein